MERGTERAAHGSDYVRQARVGGHVSDVCCHGSESVCVHDVQVRGESEREGERVCLRDTEPVCVVCC